MDRIDIKADVLRPPISALRPDAPVGESSDRVRARVAAALDIQHSRSGKPNARLRPAELADVFIASDDVYALLERAAKKLVLSARAYQRVQRVARTIADLAGDKAIRKEHVGEAISLWRPTRRRQ